MSKRPPHTSTPQESSHSGSTTSPPSATPGPDPGPGHYQTFIFFDDRDHNGWGLGSRPLADQLLAQREPPALG
jgi:hypothetical protein